MREILLSGATGLAVGIIFGLLRLPVPTPPTLAGVIGIIGIFVGYLIARKLV